MAHEVETMAYRMKSASDVPWHGLGFSVEHDATPEEMMLASKTNWTVSKRPLWVSKDREIATVDGDLVESALMPATDLFALVRDSDNKVFGPAGKNYIPNQNSTAFRFFKKFCDAGHMKMDTAGSLLGGKQVWALASIQESFKLAGDDEVKGYLLFSNPHVWGKSLIIKFVATRTVCHNTFCIGMNESGQSFRMPHVREFDEAAEVEAAQTLGIADELLEEFKVAANLLSSAKVSQDVVIKFVADLYQPDLILEAYGKSFYKQNTMLQVKDLISGGPQLLPSHLRRVAFDVFNSVRTQPGADLESSKDTMWGAFNAVTYYSDHTAGRDRDNALHSAWFGPASVMKSKALTRAVQFAEAILV